MGMTITEKILCRHTDLKEVHPGMLINARVDIALGNDITAPIAVSEFLKAGGKNVFDRERVVFVLDHFTPNKESTRPNNAKFLANSPVNRTSSIFMKAETAASSMPLLPNGASWTGGMWYIGADTTPAPTAP
jgi:3-isopropylmalate/(R)-2-methylmalate dehydratase large subunit